MTIEGHPASVGRMARNVNPIVGVEDRLLENRRFQRRRVGQGQKKLVAHAIVHLGF